MQIKNQDKKVAVVVGFHRFSVIEFYDLFQAIPGYQFYIQHLEQFTSSSKETRESYDAIVFYIFKKDMPTNDGPWRIGKELDALEDLGQSKQGILILHHAFLAFPDYPRWQDITKIDPKSFEDYAHDQVMDIQIIDCNHPITKGLEDFKIIDETYIMAEPHAGVTPLLKTDHPNNMPIVAWCHHFQEAKVFSLELGHDEQAWANPHFKRLIENALAWLCEHER